MHHGSIQDSALERPFSKLSNLWSGSTSVAEIPSNSESQNTSISLDYYLVEHSFANMTTSSTRSRPASNLPLIANFDSAHLTIGAGVAIFHLATSHVVVCYHSKEKYWFLPKGRRDAGEDSATGAEREGFEEVGISFPTLLN